MMNNVFTKYDTSESVIEYIAELEDMTKREVCENYDELARDEYIAEMENKFNTGTGIASEEALSSSFDETVDESTFMTSSGFDEIALNESFSAYADCLCKDGVISQTQYSNYNYVGKLLRFCDD